MDNEDEGCDTGGYGDNPPGELVMDFGKCISIPVYGQRNPYGQAAEDIEDKGYDDGIFEDIGYSV